MDNGGEALRADPVRGEPGGEPGPHRPGTRAQHHCRVRHTGDDIRAADDSYAVEHAAPPGRVVVGEADQSMAARGLNGLCGLAGKPAGSDQQQGLARALCHMNCYSSSR